MAVDYYSPYDSEDNEEDYIDMEVSSSTHFFSLPNNTNIEFEFHMSSNNDDPQSTTSPADELFYKGKLLPLHLPPRLQMFQKLLLDSPPPSHLTNFSTPMATPNSSNTPFESCNVSPVESCHVSRELNPDEYFRDFVSSGESNRFTTTGENNSSGKKSWTKNLKTKIKSLFGKSSGRNREGLSQRVSEFLDKEIGANLRNPFGDIGEIGGKEDKICHRRSFSGAFKRNSMINSKLSSESCSGSSSSSSLIDSRRSKGGNDVQALKRSSSASSEMEGSLIQGAIAHCKKSQQKQSCRMRKTLSEIGFHSFSSSRFVAFEDQTTSSGICRG